RGTQVEIAALQKQLETRTPALEIAQSAWEAAKQAGGVKWRPVALSLMRPEPGVRFEKEPNDVARVRGAVAGKDTSTVEGLVSGMITGFRLEGLPDKPLPGGGPGLAENGSFVLTPVRLLTGPSDDPAKLAEVELQHPRATHTQAGHPITNTIDQNPESAWSVRGRSGAVAASWQLNVRVARQPSFDGPVTVSVEGFTSRLGKGGEPLGIGADVTANAKVVAAAQELVFLDLTPKPGAAIGTRPIVTRAEATVNGEKVIVYDEAIPFTVAK
ncbi:MAG: hypothetical protein CMJ18_06295, partial [Phycisphaeraceae bacterium]|nr:hypothetical protein [Phycisphaeraceae bacterium]